MDGLLWQNCFSQFFRLQVSLDIFLVSVDCGEQQWVKNLSVSVDVAYSKYRGFSSRWTNFWTSNGYSKFMLYLVEVSETADGLSWSRYFWRYVLFCGLYLFELGIHLFVVFQLPLQSFQTQCMLIFVRFCLNKNAGRWVFNKNTKSNFSKCSSFFSMIEISVPSTRFSSILALLSFEFHSCRCCFFSFTISAKFAQPLTDVIEQSHILVYRTVFACCSSKWFSLDRK